MADYIVKGTDLTNIANAIRTQTKGTEGMTVKEMPTEIAKCGCVQATEVKVIPVLKLEKIGVIE